ncbi:uncharacterized protein F54H12.2-like [Xenia sp. Carnegie-2017]|uniref:uncharacterized protein F54H12.2-like n=1 Tax=Xenia sp. Carnegie-2017 TaxID=2897299 RepID=UPI001F04507E|nr:uncharacterized protein F54H12.2-like [Xenia sp. Carnegie-2017]
MEFDHPKSAKCTKSELDIFFVPPTQTSLEKGQWIDHPPVSSVSESGPIIFLAPGTEDYVDLSNTMLMVRAKVTKADGGNLDDGAKLTAALFYKEDEASKMEVADPANASPNKGLKTRSTFTARSAIVEMGGPIFCNVFFGERLLLSYDDLKVVLNRTSDEFALMASEDDAVFKVKLVDVYLKVHKVKVNPSRAMSNEVALKESPAVYPVRRVDCKSFIIPSGNPSLQKDNLFNGLVPKSLVVGLVASAAFNGAYKLNPFNFQHFSVSRGGSRLSTLQLW